MWTTSIKLPAGVLRTQDEAGFIAEEKIYMENIPANIRDTTRGDEILANQMGYSVDIIVEIEHAAYNGAGHFVDEADGAEYDIVRTYHPDRSNRIQLTGARREHGKT